ncbi:MAG: hypothetical protein QM706_12230 [Nitrospira sp.]
MPYYKGRKIVLRTGVQHDGRWICDYGIIDGAKGSLATNKGVAHGTYPTREEAQTAGLKMAQCIIDCRESAA